MNLCGIDGTAIVVRDGDAVRWQSADEQIHVSKELTMDPAALEFISELYDPDGWCEYAQAFHCHRHHREETP